MYVCMCEFMYELTYMYVYLYMYGYSFFTVQHKFTWEASRKPLRICMYVCYVCVILSCLCAQVFDFINEINRPVDPATMGQLRYTFKIQDLKYDITKLSKKKNPQVRAHTYLYIHTYMI